ncbi:MULTISPECIES: prealbumin-like fold domain-containing protein [unclassified Adlercreutzia]|uniref:prealbumin-like fold domain-containing protein n=1 Tax=unclassified Adlercreutzia TaxID=2636013 RepID=UPI0013EDA00B|nr:MULTISPECIES: prealbumin-like fold domain-containing protein [unclassified Adlercreutzia]
MQAARRRTTSRAARLLLALAIAAGLIPLTSFACSRQAYADTGWISVGRNVSYDNYNTTFFSDGSGWTAYCAQPSKPTPASGTYPRLSLRDVYKVDSDVGGLAAALYYGYGGPGFDPAMWPSTWYDGSPMTDDHYYAITHILIADRMYWDADAALTGCSQAFRQYYGYSCQGQEWWVRYTGMGESANPDGTYLRMFAAWQALPSSTRRAYVDSCYALRTGETQDIVVTYPHKPTGSLELWKSSANLSFTSNNNCYSLAGATYGVYSDSTCTSELATLTTNADGWTRAEGLAVGTCYVKEKAPSEGYALDGATYEVPISGGQTARIDVEETPQSSPLALWLAKVDLETNAGQPQGAATLEGAQFSVRYFGGSYDTPAQAEASGPPTATWLVSTDERGIAPLDSARTLQGRDVFRNSRGQAAIPLGTVLIQEVKAPEGYRANEGEVIVRHVTSEGAGENVSTYDVPTVPEQVIRGDLEFVKVRESSQGHLSGIPFKITSQTTGEWHVIVTDENGEAKTSAAWNAHTARTNANDAALNADGTVDEAKLDASAGVWFGLTSAGLLTKADDSLSALPYDTYTVEELPVTANEHLKLIELADVTIARDGYSVNLGTLDDQTAGEATSDEDSADESQTVSAKEEHATAVASPPPSGSLPRTSDSSRPLQLAAALAAAAGAALITARIRSRRQR